MTGRSHSSDSPVPLALFLRALRVSQLLPEGQLAPLHLEDLDPMADGTLIADRLVQEDLLTRFQADRLLQGLPEGLILGHYRVLEQLGAGGMGHVFLAEHTLLRRRVALKVLAEHLVLDAAAVARFRWEVQVAAQLNHPNIVAVYDAGETDDRHFLVMEYVDGIDLEQLVRERGPLPVALACECVRQAAMGLQHAYAAGFVHCDIKPSNFLLTRNTQPGVAGEWTPGSPLFTPHSEFRLVKIVDLGLARRLRSSESNGASAGSSALGEDLAGSIDYLAPEKAVHPQQVDIRSDLYGLGCTFYYLLTGQAPFPGGAWPDKLLRHQLDRAAPIPTVRSDVPAEVEAVVARLMSKDPADRYAVPAEVAVVLHEWLAEHRGRLCALTPEPTRTSGCSTKTPVGLDTDTLPLPPWFAPTGNPTVPRKVDSGAAVLPALPDVDRAGRASRWPTFTGLAVLAGLVCAALLHLFPWSGTPVNHPAATTPAPVVSRITVHSRPGETFATLKRALEAARDGDTVLLSGNVPLSTGPLIVQDKALTLRAEPDSQPRIQLVQPAASWQPLLSTNRTLTLEGLELSVSTQTRSRAAQGTAHLVYAEGAPVRLSQCRLIGEQLSGLVVIRQGPATRSQTPVWERVTLTLDRCELTARTSPILVEVGALGATLHVTECRVRALEERGSAIAVWVPESSVPAAGLRLELTASTIDAGRVAAFSGLPGHVEIVARKDVLGFREALLSYAGCGSAEQWRQVTHWQGEDNRYRGSDQWLLVDGRSAGVSGLEQWRALWQDAEAGSTEERGSLAERTPR